MTLFNFYKKQIFKLAVIASWPSQSSNIKSMDLSTITLSPYSKIKAYNKKKAFSIVEILIAMIIIGILAATAISLYTNYAQRAALTKVVNCLIMARDEVMRMYIDQEQFPSSSNMSGEINGLLTNGDTSEYINSVTYNPWATAGSLPQTFPLTPQPLAYIQANLTTTYWRSKDNQLPPQVFLVASASGDSIVWNCYIINLTISTNDIPSFCQTI